MHCVSKSRSHVKRLNACALLYSLAILCVASTPARWKMECEAQRFYERGLGYRARFGALKIKVRLPNPDGWHTLGIDASIQFLFRTGYSRALFMVTIVLDFGAIA